MHTPGTPSLIFLLYILVLLPWMAFRSAHRLRAMRDQLPGGTPVELPRMRIWAGTLFLMAMMFLLSWSVGRGFDYHIFALPALGVRDCLAAVVALALLLSVRWIVRKTHTEAERRRMVVFQIAPRNAQEWVLYALTVIAAGIAEEAAYRGVGMSILWYWLGTPWPAVIILSVAFALAHWIQGWKSGVIIFFIALVAHGLVYFTHTLILMMIVHVAYNFIAGAMIAREAPKYAPVN
jgi:membrane protease YdiL (CAAX protease family)